MPNKDRPLFDRHPPMPGGEGWLVNAQEQLVANTPIRLIAATTHLAAAFASSEEHRYPDRGEGVMGSSVA